MTFTARSGIPPTHSSPPPLARRAIPQPEIAASDPAHISAVETAPSPVSPPVRRWSGSAWLLLRRDAGASLAPGGALGGSQAGGRFLYRLNDSADRALALSGRIYAPLRRPAGAEAAIGLDWQPIANVPVRLLIERRQGLGSEGRSAFAVAAYGGDSVALGRGWRLDGYAQAGVVGARSRDAFIDGAVRIVRAAGPLEFGGAAWGAAQPGGARFDAGPQIALPFRAGDASLRLSGEYRFRIAGGVRPASGPTLTLGVDF
ncbi:MAG: hypothetical protein AB7O91_07705 [Sphingomonas sp.]